MDNEDNKQITPRPDLSGHYAGFISRLIAFTVDLLILSTVIVFLTWFVPTSITMMQLRPDEFIGRHFPYLSSFFEFIYQSFTNLGTTWGIFGIITIIIYNSFFVSFAGQTPGKALLGLRVVPISGYKISLIHGMIRYLLYYLSALPLGLGFLWILIDDRRMAWHDKIARTYVLYAWEARPDEQFLVKVISTMEESRRKLKEMRSKKSKETETNQIK
jgi:uncharacterized RDD family membrane protein YckC